MLSGVLQSGRDGETQIAGEFFVRLVARDGMRRESKAQAGLVQFGGLTRDLLPETRRIRHPRNRSIDCEICSGIGCARDCGVRDDPLAGTLFRKAEPEDCCPGDDDWSRRRKLFWRSVFAALTGAFRVTVHAN